MEKLLQILQKQFGNLITLEPVYQNVFRIYAPFFREDGDMMSIYLDLTQGGDKLLLRDFGNTLMRVSYSFEIDTPNKRSVLSDIVTSNYGYLKDGELIVETTAEGLSNSILQYSQLVAKVSNIDILRIETVRSMFYDDLNTFIKSEFKQYTVLENFVPTKDKELSVDIK